MNRRQVLRKAGKLAYATPLIAATVRIDQRHAGASIPSPDPCYISVDAPGCFWLRPNCIPVITVPDEALCDPNCYPVWNELCGAE